MTEIEKPTMSPSPEAEVLRLIDEILQQLAVGDVDAGQMQRLYDLQKRRVRLMTPSRPSRATHAREGSGRLRPIRAVAGAGYY